MKIVRRFRFYAAHRNLRLADCDGGKCARLHGHRYGVEVTIDAVAPSSSGAGILFSEIDRVIGPIFEALDHRTLLEAGDPLADTLDPSEVIVLPFPTSVENLAAHLLRECREFFCTCTSLALTETDSATVIAHYKDLTQWPTS